MHKPGYPRPNMPPPPMNPVPGPPSDIDDTNLYVTQLPEVFSEIQLHELFGRFGPIVSTRVIKDQSGQSRCKGFVKFTEKMHAEQAMRELHGSCLFSPTEPLQIKFANRSASVGVVPNTPGRYAQDSGGPIRNRQNPSNRFNPMGYPMGMQHHGHNGEGQGPGFFPSAAPGDMYGAPPNQPRLPPTPDQPPPPGNIPAPTDEMVANCFHHSQGWSLYIANLEENADELAIYKLFSPFGAISSINAMVDTETGKSRGYGFVNMPQYDSAFEAVRLMHGVQVAPGKNLSVSFKTNKRNSHKYPSSSSVKS